MGLRSRAQFHIVLDFPDRAERRCANGRTRLIGRTGRGLSSCGAFSGRDVNDSKSARWHQLSSSSIDRSIDRIAFDRSSNNFAPAHVVATQLEEYR
ncbi:hypothetical protein MPTK1_6g05130 [Marchantia polymorpha subsp. ruderalis]|uniref:Uncharacterized protein n=2 Tax=Marchantia polymorpha TaxID=3197 RepID=A0AAF6BNQ0_MARPO|nr:hypothetical protein MARPO_0034s0005 [Marchantia polymorpha]BBN13634.1 hypothetical protein Mp_6g05130 [Marchantia polymorpha subsp. ruderalis]|eukprot:PTQ41395.1 hypothetical protein MARPO_0034s0005 [Marchantia polymorpha]